MYYRIFPKPISCGASRPTGWMNHKQATTSMHTPLAGCRTRFVRFMSTLGSEPYFIYVTTIFLRAETLNRKYLYMLQDNQYYLCSFYRRRWGIGELSLGDCFCPVSAPFCPGP